MYVNIVYTCIYIYTYTYTHTHIQLQTYTPTLEAAESIQSPFPTGSQDLGFSVWGSGLGRLGLWFPLFWQTKRERGVAINPELRNPGKSIPNTETVRCEHL